MVSEPVAARLDPDEHYGIWWFNRRCTKLRQVVEPNGEDLFVHHSEVRGDPSSLTPKDKVGYEVGEGKRGPVAFAVGRTVEEPSTGPRGGR